MNKYAMCGCQERSTEMRKPVTKVDSGIEQDAPPSGTNPQLLILSPELLKYKFQLYKTDTILLDTMFLFNSILRCLG